MVRKNITQATTNLSSSISLIPDRYKQGIEGADWKTNAGSAQAESNYAAGIQRAVSEGRRAKGIAKVSNEEWKNAAMTKGANSIAEGVRQGLDKYQRNFAKILTAMNSAAAGLRPRTTDAMANIDARVKPVVAAAIQAARS